jgi:hypothetical protein
MTAPACIKLSTISVYTASVCYGPDTGSLVKPVPQQLKPDDTSPDAYLASWKFSSELEHKLLNTLTGMRTWLAMQPASSMMSCCTSKQLLQLRAPTTIFVHCSGMTAIQGNEKGPGYLIVCFSSAL